MSWKDNFIKPHGRLHGPQLAGWTPTKEASSNHKMIVETDVKIQMPDGVTLSADVYRPAEPGRYPAIVQFSSYNHEAFIAGLPLGGNEIGTPSYIVSRGYAQVVIGRRGVGRSEGEPQSWFSPEEHQDHASCIEWAGQQPWCNEQVCLFGTSYFGMTQFMAATLQPKYLKAMFAQEICTEVYRHLFFLGGVGNDDFFLLWVSANFNKNMMKLKMAPWIRNLLSHIVNRDCAQSLFKLGLSKIIEKASHATVMPEYCKLYLEMMSQHQLSDDFWKNKGSSHLADKITVPFVVVHNTGYVNLHTFGQYDAFANFKSQQKYLIIAERENNRPALAFQKEALAFFDYICRGCENGYEKQPAVRYWLYGANEWRSAKAWPIPEAKSRQFYLSENKLSLSAGEGKSQFHVVPFGTRVEKGMSHIMPEKLVYEYTFQEDTVVAGPIHLSLLLTSSAFDTFIVARLADVDPQGNENYLSMAYQSAIMRKVDREKSYHTEIVIDYTKKELLEPGKPFRLEFSLPPAPNLFYKGHKLRLEIASRTDRLALDMKKGYTFFNIRHQPAYYAVNTLLYGDQSYIQLDLL